MAIDPITAARLGIGVANLAGVQIPGLSSLGGIFGSDRSKVRARRRAATAAATASAKNRFDADRVQLSLKSGTVIDTIQNFAEFQQHGTTFQQPHTAIITFGNPEGPFDIQSRSSQELIDNLKSRDLGGGDTFGGAGFFLSSEDTVLQGTLSIYNNLLKFDANKAKEFKGLAQNQQGVGNTSGALFRQAFEPNFGRQQPKGPQGKSPIDTARLARLALNFVPAARPLKLRTGFAPAGELSFADQAKEQDLIIPPGFISKQPTTLERAIDPNILNGVR